MPQQLVDGVNITADTRPTCPLGTEVAMGENEIKLASYTVQGLQDTKVLGRGRSVGASAAGGWY